MNRLPLRITLVIALVALAGLGLLASGFAVTKATEHSLLVRTDEQLERATRTWARPRPMQQVTLADGRRVWVPVNTRRPLPSPDQRVQPRLYFELRKSPTGQVYSEIPVNVDGSPAVPALPKSLPHKPVTVGSSGNAQMRWRIIATENNYGTMTIGLPLTDNIQTVSRLVRFQLGIGLVVLLVLGVAAYFVIRRSLAPLRKVEQTAEAIAGGDLNRRVPLGNTNTEVDRLARSLNVMLAQIQYGVAATEASEEAARRSEAKMRRFIADASHELRTPLTTIRGFAELYRQGALTDTATLMNRIESESARMGLLVEDLIMLARLDAQRPLEHRPVDLLMLAGEAVHNARALAAEKGASERLIDLRVDSGAGTLEVSGDAARLAQVLSNLLGNALTHTPPDAAITVRLIPADEWVRIEVADTGPGMSAEAVERVFERFYRTDTSRTRASGGSGLGLSIVQSLVEAHHGTVKVHSTEGEGTVFTVELPRHLHRE